MPQLKQLGVLSGKLQTQTQGGIILLHWGISRRTGERPVCSHGFVELLGHVLTKTAFWCHTTCPLKLPDPKLMWFTPVALDLGKDQNSPHFV